MFNQYPYLNLNDLNLDYILKAIKEMRYEVTNFVSINAIKYADPIQWNITSQYEKNTIVIDPVTGTAYISVAPVPAGVSLTRPEYWTVVFDLQSFVTKANQNLANNYEEQTTTTATMNTAAGAWVIWGDVLYKALVNITAGDAYVVGSNIERITIEDVIKAIVQEIANEIQARTDADTALRGAIDDEVQARTDADTALQGAIDDEAQARSDADTAINNRIDNLIIESVYYNVVDHGADNTGVNDCLTIINEGLASGKIVYFPKGIYKISDTITLVTGQSIMGECQNDFNSPNGAIIKIDNDAKHAIEIAQGAQFVTIANITIDRTLTGTPTGDGVHVLQGSNIKLDRVHSQNHRFGFYLSATGWSYVTECIARKNFSHGFCYENTAISGALQWQTQNCLSELNDGTGFYIHGVANSYNVVTTGLFDGICTFNNKGYGVFAYGDTQGINALRITNAFIGNDNAGGIRLLPKGVAGGIIDSCYIEIAGYAGAGRNEDSAANTNACGIQIDDDSRDFIISNCHITSCQSDGIVSRNDNTTIVNCMIHNNGMAGNGVGIRQVLGKMICNNNTVRDNETSQIYFTSNTQSNVISNIVSSAILYAGGQTNINDYGNIVITP